MDLAKDRLLDSQAALIGSLLIDGSIAGELFAQVPETDFTSEPMLALYKGCRGLFLAGKPVDPVLLAQALGDGYRQTIIDCMDLTPTAARWRDYAAALRRDAALERLRSLGMCLSACADPAEGEQLLTEGLGFFDRRTGPQRQTLREGFEALEKRLSEPEKRQKYLPFGFSALDGRVRVYPGKFLILGGYPSSGKTALALNMAVSMSRSWRVGFYSLETDFPTVFNRLAAYVSGVKYAHIQDGELTEQEGETLRGILPLFPPTGLTVERASRLNVQTLQASALSQRYDVIFIDYLQLLESDLRRDASRYEQTTRVSMELHRFAQDRGVAVIALSQLSRPDKAQKKPRRPTMSDLRESGQLEQDADVVMILAQDAENPDSGDRLLYIDKNKDGKLGMVRLAFDGETQRFSQRIKQEEPRKGYGLPKPRDRWKAFENAEPIELPVEFK